MEIEQKEILLADPQESFEREGCGNFLLDDLRRIHRMTSKGLAFHLCGLYHDTLVPLQTLEAQGKKPRGGTYNLAGDLVLPAMCVDQNDKLGCAHNGNDENELNRTIIGESRQPLLDALEHLASYAPEILGHEQRARLSKQIQDLGYAVARCDKLFGVHRNNDNLISEHSKHTEELFCLAQRIEGMLLRAVREGKGYISHREYSEICDKRDANIY